MCPVLAQLLFHFFIVLMQLLHFSHNAGILLVESHLMIQSKKNPLNMYNLQLHNAPRSSTVVEVGQVFIFHQPNFANDSNGLSYGG